MSLKRTIGGGVKQAPSSPGKKLEDLIHKSRKQTDDRRTEKREQIFNSIFRQSLYEDRESPYQRSPYQKSPERGLTEFQQRASSAKKSINFSEERSIHKRSPMRDSIASRHSVDSSMKGNNLLNSNFSFNGE